MPLILSNRQRVEIDERGNRREGQGLEIKTDKFF